MSRPETDFLDAKRRSQPRLTGSFGELVLTESGSSVTDSLTISSSIVLSSECST